MKIEKISYLVHVLEERQAATSEHDSIRDAFVRARAALATTALDGFIEEYLEVDLPVTFRRLKTTVRIERKGGNLRG